MGRDGKPYARGEGGRLEKNGVFFGRGDKLASSQALPRPAAAGSPHLL